MEEADKGWLKTTIGSSNITDILTFLESHVQSDIAQFIIGLATAYHTHTRLSGAHTHTHNHFTALLDYVQDHPGEPAPER